MPEFHRLRVAEVVEETADARSVVFDVDTTRLPYRPGQFLTLRIPSDRCGSVARAYSLSSSPVTDGRLAVTVKRTADGYASNWICDNVTAGTEIDVLEPAGVFTPKSLEEDLLLFAAGSGITPIMSILKTALATGSGKVVLVYANRDEKSVIFARELTELTAAHPGRLVVLHWLESVQGLPTPEALQSLAGAFPDREAFLCGPKPFMDATRRALREAGFAKSAIHLERFASLAGNPFDTATPADASTEQNGPEDTESDAPEDAVVEVTIDGESHTFTWPADKRLLDLLKENGIQAPSSCSEGICAACECRVTEGEVTMVNNQVLEQEDLDDGYRLACQSLPKTPKVKVDYD
ncbi:ferredoxin--NADP reductase [Saccharopolyspora rhizosphaerae]|uniref:Ferredoxin--NADP reductase n=1 Tax=Saccharopolyspora rhizosphaerae TaxID=2492662 RepID=A0A3R8P6P6_9PSEU|nr:ferredoxin--NADP reductase [Saccharopolyspora rhizosphaerae]RRO17531.1 ferredoxin--NADP reductase [Saccharopolyspora rhizosphaerae]